MPELIVHHLIFWGTFIVFLLIQSFSHGLRWENEQYIELKEKRVWSVIRFGVFSLNSFVMVYLFQGMEGWEVAFEALRLTFLQLVLFWVLFDIILPVIAKKPQLWNDPNINDNNSPFDKIGGPGLGNLLFKFICLVMVWLWFSSTAPEAFVPLLPNWASLSIAALMVGGSVFIGIYQQIFNKQKL